MHIFEPMPFYLCNCILDDKLFSQYQFEQNVLTSSSYNWLPHYTQSHFVFLFELYFFLPVNILIEFHNTQILTFDSILYLNSILISNYFSNRRFFFLISLWILPTRSKQQVFFLFFMIITKNSFYIESLP